MPTLDMSPGAPTQFEAQTYQINTVASGKNWLINGGCRIAQRGFGPFTSATTPANNDGTYLFDGCYLLSDGNDIADCLIGQHTSFQSRYAIRVDIETANKKLGFVWPIEHDYATEIRRYGVASAQCKVVRTAGSSINSIRMYIMGWSGASDAITRDMVSSWNAAGADFTPIANWVILGSATQAVTGTIATCVINGAAVDVETYPNLAVFIVMDDTTTTVTDFLRIGDVKLEAGPGTTPFLLNTLGQDYRECLRYFWRAGLDFDTSISNVSMPYATGPVTASTTAEPLLRFPLPMRYTPSMSISAAADFAIFDGTVTKTASGVALTRDSRVAADLAVTTAAGLTAGRCGLLIDVGTGASYIDFSSEL